MDVVELSNFSGDGDLDFDDELFDASPLPRTMNRSDELVVALAHFVVV